MTHPLEERMKEIYGSTTDFGYITAAFLLSDGTYAKRSKGDRFKSHNQMVARAKGIKKCDDACLQSFMRETGAIRIATAMQTAFPILDLVSSRNTMTVPQMWTLSLLCDGHERCVTYVDSRPDGWCERAEGGVKEIWEAVERCRV